MLAINNTKANMKRKIAAIFAGTMLVIPEAMPASATVLSANAHLRGGQQSTLLLAQKGNTEGGQTTIVKPSNTPSNGGLQRRDLNRRGGIVCKPYGNKGGQACSRQ